MTRTPNQGNARPLLTLLDATASLLPQSGHSKRGAVTPVPTPNETFFLDRHGPEQRAAIDNLAKECGA
jgi:hypothetical protein